MFTPIACSAGGLLRLRPGRPADGALIRREVFREVLNPLGLDPLRFTVAERQAEDGSTQVLGFGQIKPLAGSGGAAGGSGALELASLVVMQPQRGQGVGTQLVRSLVAQAGQTPLFLTTTSRRAPLYQRCGFEEVPRSQVPAFLQFEYTVGLALAWIVTRDRLVLLRLATGGGSGGEQQQAEGAEG